MEKAGCKKVPLASVFNILNGNSQNYHYSRQILDIENGINYPTEERVDLQEDFIRKSGKILQIV